MIFPKKKFSELIEKTYWSGWTCFIDIIINKPFSKGLARKWFDRLVDQDDYAKDEKNQLLSYLYSLLK